MKIDFQDFYMNWPVKKTAYVGKYYFNEGYTLDIRQMTYSFVDVDMQGLEPTFEIDDVILCLRSSEQYVIAKTERFGSEVFAEKLDGEMKRTGKFIWLEETEIYHKLKGVEWINKP